MKRRMKILGFDEFGTLFPILQICNHIVITVTALGQGINCK